LVHFSIFLPVRNGWPYVKECVESILNQSYPHFVLTVLDNASTDNTVQWISSMKDPRIRMIKSQRSLSIKESWARIKDEPKLEFMTMIGHDDILDSGFLEIIKDLILINPGASLYQTGSRLINDKGKAIRSCKPVPEIETAAEYLSARFTFKRDVSGTGYVMRSIDYDQVGGIFDFERLFFADDALWLSLSKKSWKASDVREAFAVRIHPQSESASLSNVWSSLLIGLNDFIEFLKEFIEEDKSSEEVYKALAPPFILAYHRNICIYALVEACQKGKRIDPNIIPRIESSLTKNEPELVKQLTTSFIVKVLVFLNATNFRRIVIFLWKIYGFIKTKSF
jgi:glycosyltransferase involved in cell wall biosynthesis